MQVIYNHFTQTESDMPKEWGEKIRTWDVNDIPSEIWCHNISCFTYTLVGIVALSNGDWIEGILFMCFQDFFFLRE